MLGGWGMNKLNKYVSIGLVFNGIFLISSRFSLLPHVIEGFTAGAGISFIFMGLYASNHDISKLRNAKMKFLKSILGR